MPRLGSQAHHRARGEADPHVGFDSPLESRGWALWYAVRKGKARVSGTPATGPEERGLGSVPGFLVEVNLTTKMADLWDEFRRMDRTQRASFASELRQYLRASGNAVCVRLAGEGGREHGQPLWWIREEWNDVAAVGVFRPTELTRRERELTAAEVGEDREPAPVEVRRTESHEQLSEFHERRRREFAEERERYLSLIREVLEAAEYPLYNTEVADRLPTVGRSIVEKLLREEAAAGTIARRLETVEERAVTTGRRHYLYWLSEPVPLRPIEYFRTTRSLLDKLEAGMVVLEDRMSTGPLADAQALVETGLAVRFTGDDGRVRYRKSEDASRAFVAARPRTEAAAEPESQPEMSAATEEEETVLGNVQPSRVTASLEGVMAALSDLIEAQVEAGTAALRQELSDTVAALEAEQAARREAEGRLAKIREAFGI